MKNILGRSGRLLLRRQGTILSAAAVLMITYSASMVLGILRERVLVGNYYACCRELLDVYYAAFRLPDMLFQLVVLGALSASFIPVFSEQLTKDETVAYKISSSLITILLFFYIVLAIVLVIFARRFSLLIAAGFSSGQIDLMANFTRAMLIAQGFFLISNFLTAVIQSHQRFIVPALAPLFYNLGIIASIVFLAPVIGIWAPTVGVIIGALLHLIVQIPLAIKLGFRYTPALDFKLPQVREIFRLMGPRTLGLAVYQIEATVAVFLATLLPSGSLTIYHLSTKLMDLPVRLFGTSIGQAALPTLASQKAKGDFETFSKTFISSLSQIFYFAFPSMAAILILRVPLVRIAFGSSTFPWLATIQTGRAVALISLAIFSQSAIQLLVRGFYAFHDTKTPFFIGAITVTVNILLAWLLSFRFSLGVLGLAAATSISSLIEMFLLLNFFQKKLAVINKKAVIDWLKMVLAALISAIYFWITMRLFDVYLLDTTRTINLVVLTILTGGTGFVVYFLLTKIFDLEAADEFVRLVTKIGLLRQDFLPPAEIIDEPSPST